MSEKSGDVLGLAPYGEAARVLAQGMVDGTAAFLGRICLPAAEELGLLFQDRIRVWRAHNAAKIVMRAEVLLEDQASAENLSASPRVAGLIVDQGSWAEDSEVQAMWSGLLASACSIERPDDENLMFVNLLGQLTASEASLLRHACQEAKKYCVPSGLILAQAYTVSIADLFQVSGLSDIHRLDRELDHLVALGLLNGGIYANSHSSSNVLADLTPTALALNMFVRCNGSRLSPGEFFRIPPASEDAQARPHKVE